MIFGFEEKQHKVLCFVLAKPLSDEQWSKAANFMSRMSLGEGFKNAGLDVNADEIRQEWEKTDAIPHGIIVYRMNRDQIEIRTSKDISTEMTTRFARYMLFEASRSFGMSHEEVTQVRKTGLSLQFNGKTVWDCARALRKITAQPQAEPAKLKGNTP